MDSLTPKQMAFVRGYTSGKSAAEAAREAGYAPHYARRAAQFLLGNPTIRAEVERVQGAVREAADYDLNEAVKEIHSLISFAREKGNPMAAVKGAEVKLRLFGMLTDKLRVEATTLNLADVMGEARSRVGPSVFPVVATRVDE